MKIMIKNFNDATNIAKDLWLVLAENNYRYIDYSGSTPFDFIVEKVMLGVEIKIAIHIQRTGMYGVEMYGERKLEESINKVKVNVSIPQSAEIDKSIKQAELEIVTYIKQFNIKL